MTPTKITRIIAIPLLLAGMFFFHSATAQAASRTLHGNYFNDSYYYGNAPYSAYGMNSIYGSGYGNSYGYSDPYSYGYGYNAAPHFSAPLFFGNAYDSYGYQGDYYPTYGGYGYNDYSPGYSSFDSCGCDFYSGY
jgi:hypothetical protein